MVAGRDGPANDSARMAVDVFSGNQFYIAFAIISLLVMVLNILHKRIQKSFLSETLIATLVGILLGPYITDLLDIHKWGKMEDLMEKAAILTIAMALMANSFRIPKKYTRQNLPTAGVLLFAVMPLMCLACTLIVRLVFSFSWAESLMLGAIMTPTDPIVAATIASGQKAEEILPAKVRHAIFFESGANDGLAFPLVTVGLFLLLHPFSPLKDWTLEVLLYKTLASILVGLAVGFLSGKALSQAIKKDYTSLPGILAFSVSVGFFILGAFEHVEMNSVIAIFVAGMVIKTILGRKEDVEEEQIQGMMERLFTIPIFVFFGLILPWDEWFQIGWKLPVLVLLFLIFRRLPFILALKKFLKGFSFKDLLFFGWFGPVGVAAMYYAFYCYKHHHMKALWPIISMVIFASVLVHGVTASPFLNWYKKSKS